MIVFVDESGLSERRNCVHAWPPRGQIQWLRCRFNGKTLLVIAGIMWWDFYSKLVPGAVKAPRIIEFLQHLCGTYADRH
jgi:hypothetical protein